MLSVMYNTMMDDDVLETRFMFQPRGQGTAWFFRMVTPDALRGVSNPRTGRPYGREIKQTLNTRNVLEARRRRDEILGSLRLEEREALGDGEWTMSGALSISQQYRAADEEERSKLDLVLVGEAEELERKRGEEFAGRWFLIATGQRTPLATASERYLAERSDELSQTTINNFKTALREFFEYTDEGVALEDVDRPMVARFVTEFLPSKTSAKAPRGQGPATIRKKVTLLSSIWKWAMVRGVLEFSHITPWDRQAPSEKKVRNAAVKRRDFEPDEVRALLDASPVGTSMGDILRVALLSGVRLEEVASLTAEQLDEDGGGYRILEGKSENAHRYVPLVDEARIVIAARSKRVDDSGVLFPELTVRASTGKRGGAVSQRFTRLRRSVLGDQTDRILSQHSFRHTWRTAARRVRVDLRTVQEMGGWSRGRDTDLAYDHADEREYYRAEQQRIADWFRDKNYLT